MKKILFVFTLIFSIFSNAQYFEGFENGVPGSMKQTFNKGKTTWVNFGLYSFDVKNPLSDNNSAIFVNGLATSEVTTSLETPVLDLSAQNARLEFKYLQREKTSGYHNNLIVELSNDLGKTWLTIGNYFETNENVKIIHIDLIQFKPSNKSIIRFRSTQLKVEKGYPIVIDDIDIANDSTTFDKVMNKNNTSLSEIKIYPNPSNGIFRINTQHSVDISITDINGRVVLKMNELSNEDQIKLSFCQKGIYLVKIIDVDSEQTQKLILE